jgi:hypothetical protein
MQHSREARGGLGCLRPSRRREGKRLDSTGGGPGALKRYGGKIRLMRSIHSPLNPLNPLNPRNPIIHETGPRGRAGAIAFARCSPEGLGIGPTARPAARLGTGHGADTLPPGIWAQIPLLDGVSDGPRRQNPLPLEVSRRFLAGKRLERFSQGSGVGAEDPGISLPFLVWRKARNNLQTGKAVAALALDRSVAEQGFRLRPRVYKDNLPTDADRFKLAVSQISGKRLTYEGRLAWWEKRARNLLAGRVG